MLFTDPFFLLRFLPTLLALFFLAVALTPRRWKRGRRFVLANVVLTTGSLVFLYWGTGAVFGWMAGAAGLNYLVALAIEWVRRRNAGAPRPSPMPEALLTLAVTGNLLFFVTFKYVLSPSVTVSGVGFAVPRLLVPLGLSVCVCQAISYLVDVTRGRVHAQPSPIEALLYLLFFPVLLVGPLARYRDVRAQLSDRRATMAAFAFGVRRWLVGVWKVVFLARMLAGPSETAFAMSSGALGLTWAWLGAICFTLQVYFSLSGYTDMAIGFGRMFGFRLSENFRWPHGADSVTEFWRRWLITLFDWFRSYLGLSLDSPGRGVWSVTGSTVALFLGVGLWLGPSWTVAVWALGHAGIVCVERLGGLRWLARCPVALRYVYVAVCVVCLWVVFRADTVADAGVMLRAMFGFGGARDVVAIELSGFEWGALILGGLSVAPLWSGFSRWLVTVDAVTTSILFLVSTSFVFVWRSLVTTVRFVTRRPRRARDQDE